MTEIVIVNASRTLTDREAVAIVPALQVWDDTMLRPAWGFDSCTYSFLPFGQLPTLDDPRWPIFLNRHSNDPGALGWHDSAQKPFGRVFVGDCKAMNISWTVDVSHEAAEMRGDPTIDRIWPMLDGRRALVELCDPVEDDILGINIDGILLSDFVLPSYFSTSLIGPFDYRSRLTAPCPTLAPGGYQSILEDNRWTQITAMQHGLPQSFRSMRYQRSHRLPRIPEPKI